MDPQRFDSLAKRLGTRLSRRGALAAGAGAALGAVTVSKIAPSLAQDADTTAKDRFISIRTYPYTGPISAAQSGLKDLVTLMEQQPGFLAIDFVDGDDAIHVIATFLDKSTAVDAARLEDDWIEEHAQAILSGDPEIHSGDVFLRSELFAGCGCTTGVENACHSSRLTCCATTATPGGEGICLTTQTTCPAVEGASPTATSVSNEPTATPAGAPTEAPTDVPACTSAGCDCIGGTDGACDDGLVCCADIPGGNGTCMTDSECSPSCTGEGCGCIGGAEGGCDDGLVCCSSAPGAYGACLTVEVCYPTCTQEGCTCDAGVEGNCDDGLCCVGNAAPGGRGTCSTNCGEEPCTGAGCACDSGTESSCDDGLSCCGASEPGGTGTCQESC